MNYDAMLRSLERRNKKLATRIGTLNAKIRNAEAFRGTPWERCEVEGNIARLRGKVSHYGEQKRRVMHIWERIHQTRNVKA